MGRLPPFLLSLHPDPAAKRRQHNRTSAGMCFADKRQGLSEPSLLPQGDLQELRSTNMSNPLENSKWEMMERGLRDTGLLHDRNGGAGGRRSTSLLQSWELAVCVARTHSAARVQGARRGDPPLAGRLVHARPQDAGLRAAGWPACVPHSWRDAVSAALTCACMSTVVRTGRDAKAADRVPVSRDPRPLMGSRHKTRDTDGAGHPPHPPLLNFNRRAVNSPLNSQRPIRASAATASQSQYPPLLGPRPLSRDSSGPPEREN